LPIATTIPLGIAAEDMESRTIRKSEVIFGVQPEPGCVDGP
jgi:hypothetical protein